MNETDPRSDAPPLPPTAAAGTVDSPPPDHGAAATMTSPPEPDNGAPPPLSQSPPGHAFHFHGTAQEYFRIWIVNTLLTLLTAGLFFPWAKVRKRRYVRGSTELMGSRFDYRADPVRLLVGHLMIAAFFLGYSVFGVVYPVVRWGVLMIGIVLLPWVVVRSLTFNAHNTVYRGLRFRFSSSLSPAVSVFLFQSLLVICTLGIYYPAWARAKRQLVVSGHRLGDAYFSFQTKVGPFYVAYLAGGAIMIGMLFVGGLYVAGLTAANGAQAPSTVALIPFFAVYGLGWWIAKQLIHAQLFNHVWNHTHLDDHRFHATMSTGRWVMLQLVNAVAVVGTLGAMYPWAVIRSQTYTASCLRFVPAGPVEGIRRLEAGSGSATGDTAAEFAGIDFGI